MRRVLLSAVICSLFTVPLRAQDFLNRITAEAGAGFSFPVGTITDRTRTGFNFVASGGPRFNRLTFTLDYSLHYLEVKNSFQDTELDEDLFMGSLLRVWSLTVNPGYEFIKKERFSSYATGGYGLYSRRLLLSAPGPVATVVCDDFWSVCINSLSAAFPTATNGSLYKGGYNAGGGVTFGSRTKFFVEVRYHHMFVADPGTEIIPLTFGVRW